MKKLLVVILVLFTFNVSAQSLLDEYGEYCKADSVVVGYSFVIKEFQNGMTQNVMIFNPKYRSLLIDYDGLTYARGSDFVNPAGYWHFVRTIKKGMPEKPIRSIKIKERLKRTLEGYFIWKESQVPLKKPTKKSKK